MTLLLALLLACVDLGASADATAAARTQIDTTRQAFGLPAMEWNGDLDRDARRWSTALIVSQHLRHDPDTVDAENVARHRRLPGHTFEQTAARQIGSYWLSPPHHANLIGHDSAGIAVVVDRCSDQVWSVVRLRSPR